ncbi:Os04g0152950 [Oryza sativa Japonica Group]|uniref:Os04g0152950 protein n=1 Tax=Oryza sativa subsp. japonica TaxID=39947 RepID=A0A0N7KIJ7_ORYSJ|nr:Os04g0152950 [Oryza sativa Japonica Group]
MASQSRSECSLSSPTIHRRHAWRRIVGAVSGVTATTSTAMMWTATLQIVVMRITEATARKRGTGVTAAMKGVATDTDSTTTTTPSSSAATAGVVATTATATAMMTTATEGQAMVVKHGEAVTPPSRRVSTARGRETARQGAVTGAKALAMVDDAVPMRRAQSDAAKNITDMHKHQPPSGKHALVAPTADFNGFLAKAHNLDAALQIDWPALQVGSPAPLTAAVREHGKGNEA